MNHNIEESKKDSYIENHFEVMKVNLEIIQTHFRFVMSDVKIITKIMKSKNK